MILQSQLNFSFYVLRFLERTGVVAVAAGFIHICFRDAQTINHLKCQLCIVNAKVNTLVITLFE